MPLTVEVEQEADNRWLAEVPAVPGAMAYGDTRAAAVGRAQALARGRWPTGWNTASRRRRRAACSR